MLVSELFADAISSLAFEPFRFGMFALLDFSAADLMNDGAGKAKLNAMGFRLSERADLLWKRRSLLNRCCCFQTF
jgi:hypothetical protein